MSEKRDADKLQLLLFCMEIPFYQKGIYHKEIRRIVEILEQTSIPVKTVIKERIEKHSVNMIDHESDHRKLQRLIDFNEMILKALF